MIVAKSNNINSARINTSTSVSYAANDDDLEIRFYNHLGSPFAVWRYKTFEALQTALEWLDSIHNVKFAPQNNKQDAE